MWKQQREATVRLEYKHEKTKRLTSLIFGILSVSLIIVLIIIAEHFEIKALLVVCVVLFFLWFLAINISAIKYTTKGLSKKRVIISHILTYVMVAVAGLLLSFQFYEWQNLQQYSAEISELRIQRDEMDDNEEKQAIYLQIDEVEKKISKAIDVVFVIRMVFLTNLILFSILRMLNDMAQKRLREKEEKA